VTRASARPEQHRSDYAQLLSQVPAIIQLSQLDSQGREVLRVSRTQVLTGGADFSRDVRFTETVARGLNFAPATFEGTRPMMSISEAHFSFDAAVTVADVDLRFLSDFLSDAEVGKAAFAYVVDPRGRVLASSARGPEIAKDLAACPKSPR
jgi:hypothetical protein